MLRGNRRLCAPATMRVHLVDGHVAPPSAVATSAVASSARGSADAPEPSSSAAPAANEPIPRLRVELLLAGESRILGYIASGAPLDILAPELCACVEELLPGARCALRRAVDAPHGPGAARAKAAPAEPPPVQGVHVFGSISESGVVPQFVDERTIVANVPRDSAGRALRRRGIGSYWVEPVIAANGDRLGALAVYRQVEGAPSAEELDCSSAIVRLASIAIERARSDERSRQQLAQLAHVARLATMGELASGLAHELNQPLCAIVNYAEACVELVGASSGGSEDLRRALAEVARQAQRAGEVIRRLREFVRWRDLQCEPVDVNRMVREVVGLTSVELRQCDVCVRLSLGHNLPRVLADPVQIQQVVVNLTRNACDAMSATDAARRRLTIRTARVAGAVEVALCDAGAGIPDGGGERLFEPFFSTKPDGMGMGLSISRSIIEAHGGRISAKPNRQRGATFRFTLPVEPRRNRANAADRIRG